MKKNYSDKMEVQEWMATALIELMQENSFEDITVTQIAHKAGVSRMTYYRNYVSKEDILHSYSSYLTQLLAQQMREKDHLTAKQYWILLFSFLYKKRDFIQTLITSRRSDVLLDITNENIRNITSGMPRYVSYYVAGGLYNLILLWADTGFKQSAREMAQLLMSLTSSSLVDSVTESYMKTFDKLI